MIHRKQIPILLILTAGLFAAPLDLAIAQSPEFYAGPQIGLLGLGASAEVDFGMASISGEFGYVPVSEVNLDEEDIEYAINTDFYGGIILANISLADSRFSIGAGVLLGGYNASGNATDLTDEIDIGDNVYDAADVGDLEAEIDYSGPAPAIMLGLRGKGFNVGIGVAFTGSPNFDLAATGPLQNSEQFLQDLDEEREAVQDELDVLPVLPMFRIGWQFGL